MSESEEITLDGIESLKIDPNTYPNEIGTLGTLFNGLSVLNASIERSELAFEKAGGDKFNVFVFGSCMEPKQSLDVKACMFHWFRLTLCNYARLVGFIRGLHLGEFGRADLTNKNHAERIKKSIAAYVSNIPELSSVSVWRNKVFAHFAITDPYKDDNISTLDMSVISPVTFEGRYFVGSMVLTQGDSTCTQTSMLPKWSLTEVFESLTPRFWPGVVLQESTPSMEKE